MNRLHEGDPISRRDFLRALVALGIDTGHRTRSEQNLPGFVDKYTGDFKQFKKPGQHVIDYYSGFLSDDKVFRLDASLSARQFVAIRAELEEHNWGLSDSFFFTYGREDLDLYSPKDTAQDPNATKQQAREFAQYQISMQPRVKRIGIAHSAGFIPLLEILANYPDIYDKVVFLSSPLYGLEPDIWRVMKVGGMRQALRPVIGFEEQLTKYLFSLWKDKNYRENIDAFFEQYIAEGNEVYCFTTENDTIVPKKSALLKSALEEVHGKPIQQVLPVVWSIYPWDAHGAVFTDKKTLESIAEIVGPNKTT